MSAGKSHRVLWYTRREGMVRGPYPKKQISRYVLLGRIRTTDQVRPDGGDWQELSACPELIPEVVKLPPSAENKQKLLMARLREDERQPGDRRERAAKVPQELREQRSGPERRQPESAEALRHRGLRHQVSHQVRGSGKLYRYPLVATVLVMLGFLLSYLLKQVETESVSPDCAATPQPGVKWDNCNLVGLVANRVNLLGASINNARLDNAQLSGANLDGVNLEYTSLNLSNLQQADLSHARLVGVTLRGSDLRDSKLVMADLSYANLSDANIEGADFSGAILDNTIWIDQKLCVPGSIGVCKRYKTK
ncbi:MAG: pentapeptide repeat-containing protein [Pseudomonadota bacterium]|nr:pentapeptide repeat-containing protein [Pseudomonadota bacterium]